MLRCLMVTKTRTALVLAAGIALGLSFGLTPSVLADKQASIGAELPWQDARTLAEVLERVKRDYVNPVDDHQLLQAAIRGMVSSLDPYSAFLDVDEYDEIKISSSGEYSGVGIEVSMEDEQVVVVTPLEGSPAAAAGIRTGDVIATIDGVPVNTIALTDTIGRMRGKEGTTVKIGILRQGNAEPLQFTLKRSRVELHSVKSQMLEPGYGYVRIAEFSETTGDDVEKALAELRKRNAKPLKGLVLDMRNNPGGVLESAVAVADAFLDKGVIVTAKGRTPESKFEMDATPGDDLSGAPIVVLVNGGSASAAEIVAGALRDHRRAVIVGTHTYGKGVFQELRQLSNGGAIDITVGQYFLPDGENLGAGGLRRGGGIKPDVVVSAAPNAKSDPQLRAALAILAAKAR